MARKTIARSSMGRKVKLCPFCDSVIEIVAYGVRRIIMWKCNQCNKYLPRHGDYDERYR